NFNQKIENAIKNSENQIEFIRQFFMALAVAEDCDKERGCYLGNALVQLSEKDHDIKKITAELLKGLQKIFASSIEGAKKSGQLKTLEDSEILAWHLTNLWNGIHVTRRMESSPEILRSMIEINLKLLE